MGFLHTHPPSSRKWNIPKYDSPDWEVVYSKIHMIANDHFNSNEDIYFGYIMGHTHSHRRTHTIWHGTH